jgi:phytoene synthase
MSIFIYPWEQRLLKRAYEAFESGGTPEGLELNNNNLKYAYKHCAMLTREHSKTFYMASGLLPKAKRQAVRALYAFCRISDDLVDLGEENVRERLDNWQRKVLTENPGSDDLVALAWADTRIRYGIPEKYAEQLIEGVRQDLISTQYETFEELTEYCYGVASTVGLMSMHIIGFSGLEAIPYAIKLGVALQLTNILRDVGEDWRAGRLYLPQEELHEFELTEADIEAGCVDDRWRSFMKFQIQRNRQLYDESMPGIALLYPDGRFAITAAAELYKAILEDIEAHDNDVFHRRSYVNTWDKLSRLPSIWRLSKIPYHDRQKISKK